MKTTTLSKTMEYSLAYEAYRRDLEIAIEKKYGIQDFAFGISGEGDSTYLTLDDSNLANTNVQDALGIDYDGIPLDDDLLEDYAHALIQHVTGDSIKRVVLVDEGRKVIFLA